MMENKTLSVTDAIYQELVDGLKTGLDWPHFLVRHGASKGPLYNAIGRFFTEMEPKVKALDEVQGKVDDAGLRLDFLDQKIKEAEGSLARLEDRKSTLNKQIEPIAAKLVEKGALIKQAKELEKLGFDIERLRQLREALAEIGAKHGLKGKEAVRNFFAALKDYDAVLGAGLELKTLQAQIDTKRLDAERWQAEARAAEAKCKARKTSIDITEKLLSQGVRESDLPQWGRILNKAGVAPEGLAQDLEEYSSLEAVVRARQKQADGLRGEVATLQSQVKALTQERAESHAAIQSVKEAALAEVEQAGQGVVTSLKDLDTRVQEFGVLKEQLGDLRAEASLARALRSSDPDSWKTVAPQSIMNFLTAMLAWAEARDFNPELEPPRSIQQTALLSSFDRVRFVSLLRWLIMGLAEADQKEPTKRLYPYRKL